MGGACQLHTSTGESLVIVPGAPSSGVNRIGMLQARGPLPDGRGIPALTQMPKDASTNSTWNARRSSYRLYRRIMGRRWLCSRRLGSGVANTLRPLRVSATLKMALALPPAPPVVQ